MEHVEASVAEVGEGGKRNDYTLETTLKAAYNPYHY